MTTTDNTTINSAKAELRWTWNKYDEGKADTGTILYEIRPSGPNVLVVYCNSNETWRAPTVLMTIPNDKGAAPRCGAKAKTAAIAHAEAHWALRRPALH